MNRSRSYKLGTGHSRSIKPLRFLSPIHKATRHISLFLEGRNASLGVSNIEGHLLAFLRSYGPCPINELLRVFGLKKSTMTSILDRLAERTLISRDVYPADRRSFLIGLTRSGNATAERVRGLVEQLEEEIAGHTSKRDLAGFQAVMDAIAAVTLVEVRNISSSSDKAAGRRKENR